MPSRLAVISPHLDDGVLSCGELIFANPGSVVVSVFAGGPNDVSWLTPCDNASGFALGDDVVSARRAEDIAASQLLGAAAPIQLDFWESQYRDPPFDYRGPFGTNLVNAIADTLHHVLADQSIDKALAPLGMQHEDHRDVRRAVLALAAQSGEVEVDWWMYDELPYREEFPSERQKATESLANAGFERGGLPLSHERHVGAKKRAVLCYRSQVKSLGDCILKAVQYPETANRLVRMKASS